MMKLGTVIPDLKQIKKNIKMSFQYAVRCPLVLNFVRNSFIFFWIQIKHPKIQEQILLDQSNFSRFLWIQIKDKKILKAKM